MLGDMQAASLTAALVLVALASLWYALPLALRRRNAHG
jgi:hypothetical protein